MRENLLEEDLSCEPQQHWRVRDALAFTPKALRGDVLVKLLKDSDPHLRESALLALRRLLPIHWVHHVDMVSAMLIDRTPEVRIAALLVLFELDVRDLDLQAGAKGRSRQSLFKQVLGRLGRGPGFRSLQSLRDVVEI